MLTFEEIKERLVTYDEITLLEILGVTAEDLVERFSDIIEQDIEKYRGHAEDIDFEGDLELNNE